MTDIISSFLLLGAIGSGGNMPFWATANQFGLMPETSGGVAIAYAGMDYDREKTLQWHWALSLAARSDASSTFQAIPDEVYAGIKWKPLSLDIGIKHRERDFLGADPFLGSLSTTSGHIAWSSNSRSLPGYTIELNSWKIPGTNGILQLDGAWGDYMMTDARYVSNSLLHNMRIFGTLNLGRFSFTGGFDHFAVWAGTSPEHGRMPHGLGNYFRMCLGMSAKGDGTISDQINVIGDQRGGEMFRLIYRGDSWTLTAQHDIPYEDKSGMRFQNFPDGVNTISFSFKDKDRWVSDVVYEYVNTMKQSGAFHNNPDTGAIEGGCDDYFNNGEYKSGWTAYGRAICLPLITPFGTADGSWNRNEVSRGFENNRLKAHHFALSGKLFRKAPYRLMMTLSQNFGLYDTPWETGRAFPEALNAFSAGFSSMIPCLKEKLQVIPSIYFDAGNYRPNAFAFTLGLKYQIR